MDALEFARLGCYPGAMITAPARPHEIERAVRDEANALATQRAREVERAEDFGVLAFGERITGWRYLPYFHWKRYPHLLLAPAPQSLAPSRVVLYDAERDCIAAVRARQPHIVSQFSFADLFSQEA
jgi:hypothetical protein